MNERAEISGAEAGAAAMGVTSNGIDERLAVLHRTLKRIANARAQLDLREAEALREAQKLQLWKQLGHASLMDYMVQELGYASHRTAEDRLRLANALPALPQLTAAIESGQINMTQARELARVATPETEQKWIAKALDLNVRQTEQVVAGHCKGDLPEDPIDPRMVRETMYLTVRPETRVLFREARKALEKERGEKLDEDAVMEALCRLYLRGIDRPDQSTPGGGAASHVRSGEVHSAPSGTRADAQSDQSTPGGGIDVAMGDDERAIRAVVAAGAPYRVAVTVCRECRRGWQHGGGLIAEMMPPAVERAMCDAQWIGDLDTPIVERARQSVTAALRRKVLHRDGYKCRVPGCNAHTNLDAHHMWELVHGGPNTYDNLITLCEAHHLAYHAGTLLIERVGDDIVFKFEGRNRLTRATREVATKEALKARGLDRAQVREIMQRTINKIGETDLSEDQWLTIALRYASEVAS